MKKWFKMLGVGAVSGAIQAVAAYAAVQGVADPKQILVVAIVGAITGAGLYAKNPPKDKDPD